MLLHYLKTKMTLELNNSSDNLKLMNKNWHFKNLKNKKMLSIVTIVQEINAKKQKGILIVIRNILEQLSLKILTKVMEIVLI